MSIAIVARLAIGLVMGGEESYQIINGRGADCVDEMDDDLDDKDAD